MLNKKPESVLEEYLIHYPAMEKPIIGQDVFKLGPAGKGKAYQITSEAKDLSSNKKEEINNEINKRII